MDSAMLLVLAVWAVGHAAQIACAIRAGLGDGPAPSRREERLLALSLFTSLPSLIGGLCVLLEGWVGTMAVAGLLVTALFLPFAVLGTVLAAALPPWRGSAPSAFASRLCAIVPSSALCWLTMRMLLNA